MMATLQPCHYPTPRDLPPFLEFDFPNSSTSRFPISSIRQDAPRTSNAMPPAHPPRPVFPRHDPLHILSQTQPPPPPPRSYPFIVPAPPVAPGVLADGVLTVKLPAVRRFLDAATIAPPECPPLPTDKRVLVLVALSVFYHPLHPAHWHFWNKEQQVASADLIQSVLGTTPTSILPPIGWIDVSENLKILNSVQTAYAQILAPLPWYATYSPAGTKHRMNLRKRKPPVVPPSVKNITDEEENLTPPPRKRARTRRSPASRSVAKSSVDPQPAEQDNKQADQPGTPAVVEAALSPAPDDPPVLSKVAKRERIESPDTVVSATATATAADDAPQIIEEAPQLRKSVRQRERKAKATNSNSPTSMASALTPSVPGRGLSRARTPSRASSAVTPGESGSSTAVSLCEEEDIKSKATKTVAAEDEADEDEVEGPPAKKPRIARPRAKSGSRARTATKNKTDTIIDEVKTDATVQARPKARSRAKTRRR